MFVSSSFGLSNPNSINSSNSISNLRSGSSNANPTCARGPIVISIQGTKSDFENGIENRKKVHRNENINSYNEFESKAKNLLSQAFSNKCKVDPNQIQLKLEPQRCDKNGKVRDDCQNEVIGPDFQFNRGIMYKFTDLIYPYRNKKCQNYMNYPYKKRDETKNWPCLENAKINQKNEKKPPLKIIFPQKRFWNESDGKGQETSSNKSEIRVNYTNEGTSCLECNNKSASAQRNVIQETIERARNIDLKASGPFTCEPQGYNKDEMSKERLNQLVAAGKMGDVIRKYSERAQGAVNRAFLALVKPEQTVKASQLLEYYKNFESIPSKELHSILQTESQHQCYPFVKAALSGDYSILKQRKRDEERDVKRGLRTAVKNRFNDKLLEQTCNLNNNKNKGDLALSHRDWTTMDKNFANYAAGNSGPSLKERGFINILDKKYGVADQYTSVDGRVDESLIPNGAIIVYQCNDYSKSKDHNYRNFENSYKGGSPRGVGGSNCKYGDISLKAGNGFIRDFYNEKPVSITSKRVVVGVYIKPTE